MSSAGTGIDRLLGDATEGATPRVWHLAPLFLASEAIPIALATAAIALLAWTGRYGDAAWPITIERLRALFDTPEGTLIAMGCVAVVCLVLALVVGASSLQPLQQRLRLGPGRFSIREIAVASVGGLALSSTLGVFLRFLPGYEAGGLGKFQKLCAGLDASGLWLALVVVGLLAPLGEELFYRGTMQTRLMGRFGTMPGLFMTSAVFGLAHLDPLHIVLGFGMGLYLGWITVLSQSCRTTIAVHAVNNTFAVLVAASAGGARKPVSDDPMDFAMSGLIALVVALSCLRWLYRRTTRRESVLALRQADFASHLL